MLGIGGTIGLYGAGPLGCLAVLAVAVINRKKQNMFDWLGILFLFLINLGLAFFLPISNIVRSYKLGYPVTMTFSVRPRDGEKTYYHLTEQDWINIGSSQKPIALNFASSDITEDELARLAGNRQIRQIQIHSCPNITDNVVQPLSEIPNLKRVALVNCQQLKDPDFSVLNKLKNLSDLNLTCCVNLTEKSLGSIAGLPRLKKLYLSGCLNANESVLSKISRLKGLRLLDLMMCRNITDDAVAKLLPMKHLRVLSLHGCLLVTGKGVEQLGKLPIKAIDFPVHLYSDEGIDSIAKFSKLTTLSLTSSARVCHNPEIYFFMTTDGTNLFPFDEKDRRPTISDESILKLGKMKSLRRLYMSHNRESEMVKALKKKLPKCEITG